MDNRILPGRRCGARAFGTFVAASVTALGLFGGTGDANAAGFALKEQSATALGNAFAGATAGAEDISYMFFNPAGLVRHEGTQVAVALSYIIPTAEMQNGTASTLGGTAMGTALGGDAGVDALVPALYAKFDLSPDLKLGVGINAPFGLTTEFDDGWIGRYHAQESSLTTINLNPAIAYRVNEKFSVGAGLSAQYADVTLSQAVDFNTISAGGLPLDGFAEVTGDDWAFGLNFGILFEPRSDTRIGFAYRSQIDHDIKGDGDFTIPGGATPALFGGAFADTTATAALTTPDTATLGVHHEIDEAWAVMGEIGWTGWSDFDEIRVQFANPVQPDSVTIEDWDDVWFFALGATWKANDQWTVRAGVAYDQSPIPDETRTPRLPGEDRTWIALGTQYQAAPNFTVDAGYTHIFVDDSSIDLTTADPNNTFRGNLSGEFEGSIDILTVQGTFRF